MKTKSYESKYAFLILGGMTFAIVWGFIGVFWAFMMLLAKDQPFEIIALTGITGLIGWCVPAIIEFIDEGEVDLRPRFLK